MPAFAAISLGGVEITRPFGLLALVLPLLLLWLSRRPARPVSQATGTFSLWRSMGTSAEGVRRKRSLPLSRWLLILCLTSGALALAGPRRPEAPLEMRWRLLLDRSPSMFLPYIEAGQSAVAAEDSKLRIEHALELFDDWRTELGAGEAAFSWEWIAQSPNGPLRFLGEVPPPDWLQPPVPAAAEVELPTGAARPSILISDHLSGELGEEIASVFTSGGAPVPGLIASGPEGDTFWDGSSLKLEAGVPRAVHVSATLPEALAEFVQLWAEDRGLRRIVSESSAAPAPDQNTWTALSVLAAGEGQTVLRELGSDGWIASGPARTLPAALKDSRGESRTLDPWLPEAGESGAAPVAWGAGVVAIAWDAGLEITGDPVSFAVSWAELFDKALLNRPQIVNIEERLDAGQATVAPPPDAMAGERVQDPLPATFSPEVILAIAAACLAFASRLAR